MNSTKFCYINFGNSPLTHFFVRFYFKLTGFPSEYQGRGLILMQDPSSSPILVFKNISIRGRAFVNGYCLREQIMVLTAVTFNNLSSANGIAWKLNTILNGNNSQFRAWIDQTLVQTANDSTNTSCKV